MKKLLLFFTLIMSLFFTAQAGYVIRGINAFLPPDNLKNYTLAFNANGDPVSASSMYTASGGSTGKNTIVIISALQSTATCFPVSFLNEYIDIEVRDFHYIPNGNKYVLCGSRRDNFSTRAFVAVINGVSMKYNEYTEANMFYSIWVDNYNLASMDYYVCGTSGSRGVIASINKTQLAMTNCYVTGNEWEYHKIIAKENIFGGSYRLVVSGRNPDCTRIGYTLFLPSFSTMNSYYWAQNSEPNAHCVVCDYVLASANDQIILASSYQNNVTLNLVTSFASPSMQVTAYRYAFPNMPNAKYNVQDIGMFPTNDMGYPHISVVGYIPAWTTFSLLPKSFSENAYNTYERQQYSMSYYACTPFKVAEPAPELLMPTEQESEIITSHDRITVKDISMNIHYQIYSATGQLLQTGITTSDISTAQFSKGLYILRLENGKAYKFVK